MKKQYLVYVGFVLAIIAALGGVIYPDKAEVLWGIAGFFGFGSLPFLRQFIESKGWKTYVVGGITALAGLLSAFGVISTDVYKAWLAVASSLGGIAVQQALSKAKLIKADIAKNEKA
jgi:hypothetical protein